MLSMTRRLGPDLAPSVPAVHLRLAEYASAVGDVATAKKGIMASLAVSSTQGSQMLLPCRHVAHTPPRTGRRKARLENAKAAYPASCAWPLCGDLIGTVLPIEPVEAARCFERALARHLAFLINCEPWSGLPTALPTMVQK